MMSAALTTPLFVAFDADGLGLLAGVLDHQALDVEDDVGHVLDDAGDGADLVLHALDLDARDGAAFQAGQQDAAQAVADGHAEAALERLGDELAVGVGQRRRDRWSRGWAVPGHAIGYACETPPIDRATEFGSPIASSGLASRSRP